MAFEIPKQLYSGKIVETVLGVGDGAVKIGGEDSFPFHLFEGTMPNRPRIAMEIWDYDPSEEWPEAALEPFRDVVSSPVEWARKCVDDYGADIIVVQLKSTDPNGMDRGPEEAAEVVQKVMDALKVPVVAWGTANNQKDEEVLKKISEACQGKNVALAPVEEANHKGVGASALGYGHIVVASSPIDVNLAKQLNILLGNLGVSREKIVIDPTTGGLGYGLEYSYSVIERIRMAALTQEDDKLQMPIISNIGNEIWKCKEAGLPIEEAPTLGDPERRAILMETVAAVSYLMAGSDVVILRHPESVKMIRSFIDLMCDGGMASQVEGIAKRLEVKEADLLGISPEPVLEISPEEKAEERKAKPKKEEKAPPKAKKVKETKPAPKKEEKVVEIKREEKVAAAAEAQPEVKAKEEAKAKAEREAKAAAEAEAKAKAEAEARAKAEAEAKAKAEAEAKARAEAEERAKAKEKEREQLQALRLKRAREREKLEAERRAQQREQEKRTPAPEQLSLVEKLIRNLDRIHRRSEQ
ncbi:MAG: acetyl-CoA decarbonylase/synthase complex subunit delta [Deltaproteobacteria bacterium]|nr:acetyl-CoA decarbonylase/synthase complex subunit delta [Deltaproteobacteria bacterium]